MHGNIVMKGYFVDPEATNAAFEGRLFHSGDLAVCHHDGYIELRDRKKDVIISGGENISTIEVEQVIAQHPAVMECAVIAIPDAKWGERPKAFVIVKPGQSASEAEIIAFCREHLAHFKCPATVEFGPLPRNSTGKIQKFVLRSKEWGEHDMRIHSCSGSQLMLHASKSVKRGRAVNASGLPASPLGKRQQVVARHGSSLVR